MKKYNVFSLVLAMFLLRILSGCGGNSSDNPIISEENTTSSEYQDMLTPEYYASSSNTIFKDEVDTFLEAVKKELLHHPLDDSLNNIPQFTVPTNGEFGANKGTSSHHAAVDLHVGNNNTTVALYAAHDGIVSTYRDALKYRHYLAISKDIFSTNGMFLGKIVTLYAHIDLDLDESDLLLLDGLYVNKGDLISRHLYSETVGGPHLHFEVRYYRPTNYGDETFYGIASSVRTELSQDPWRYGYWNKNVGYGFSDVSNLFDE